MKKVDWKTIETKDLAGLICDHLKDEVKMYVLQGIILIPSYFILAKQVIFYLKRNIKTNIRPE